MTLALFTKEASCKINCHMQTEINFNTFSFPNPSKEKYTLKIP
jgi:hypothetical protein